MEIITYLTKFDIVDTTLIDDENVIAIIHTRGCDDCRAEYVGVAKFWLVHDRYDITVLDGLEDEVTSIMEELCNNIIHGTEQMVE